MSKHPINDMIDDYVGESEDNAKALIKDANQGVVSVAVSMVIVAFMLIGAVAISQVIGANSDDPSKALTYNEWAQMVLYLVVGCVGAIFGAYAMSCELITGRADKLRRRNHDFYEHLDELGYTLDDEGVRSNVGYDDYERKDTDRGSEIR